MAYYLFFFFSTVVILFTYLFIIVDLQSCDGGILSYLILMTTRGSQKILLLSPILQLRERISDLPRATQVVVAELELRQTERSAPVTICLP